MGIVLIVVIWIVLIVNGCLANQGMVTVRNRSISHYFISVSMFCGSGAQQQAARNVHTTSGFDEILGWRSLNVKQAFSNQVWNCTLTTPGVGTTPLKIASKESAFVYAIASAGVSHSLAKACAKGLIEDCGCGPTPSSLSNKFVWAGCSDNVRYGNSFGRKFIDVTDKVHSDARALMNLHNNRVGRRLLASRMGKECKCHGVSGSCVTKTCWKVVPRLVSSHDFFSELINNMIG
ncbi:wnt family protein, partial [Ostertagia ostertagi]